LDQCGERLLVDSHARPQLHMAHVLSGSFQQSRRIRNVRAQEEAYVDVRRERIDVTERRVVYARGGMAVMDQFAYVVAARSHALVPTARDRAEVACSAFEPRIDRGIPLNRRRKPEQSDPTCRSGH
jgi:hypothetical protein